MAAPEKAAETKAAAALLQIAPAIAMQAKTLSTGRAFRPFGVCAALAACRVGPPGRRSRLTQKWRRNPGGVRHCHSHVEAAAKVKRSSLGNSMAPDRFRPGGWRDFHGKVPKQTHVKDHRPNRRSCEHPPGMGPRCPQTPTDPPGSIAAEFNDRATKGVVPTVTYLGK